MKGGLQDMSMSHDEYIDLSVDNVDDTKDIKFDTYNDEIRINPVLKTHLDDGDKLVWYKDPTIIATWHSNGRLDVPCFDATDVTISAVNFRILKGHWRTKDEHGVGTESNHWLYDDKPISEYLDLYPDFWKANEIKAVQPKKERKPRQKKETSDKTVNVILPRQEDIVKEYKYKSEKLLFGSDFTELYSKQLRREATPSWVVEDMVALLPNNIWNPYSKFLDIYCKSGIFLEVIIDQLMNRVDYSVIDLHEPKEIYRYIVENQIYALCWKKEYADLARTAINGKVFIEKNIKLLEKDKSYITDKEFRTKFMEIFGNMKIDAVVGNPPYNNDIYLDFVTKAYEQSSNLVCMITPAKWQAKSGEKNEAFRQNIVPHMSKIVYYPDETEIFDISCQGGITYFYTDKNNIHYDNKNVRVINKGNITLEYSGRIRQIIDLSDIENNILDKIFGKAFLLDNRAVFRPCKNYFISVDADDPSFSNWIDPCGKYIYKDAKQEINIKDCGINHLDDIDKYKLLISGWGSATPYFKAELYKPYEVCGRKYTNVFVGSLEECKSAYSFYSTKLVWWSVYRFFRTSKINDDSWRFVPDPGDFDHIFTDEELYKKYNLTDEEIAIIESVIKEHK